MEQAIRAAMEQYALADKVAARINELLYDGEHRVQTIVRVNPYNAQLTIIR